MKKYPTTKLGWVWYCLLLISTQASAQTSPESIQHQVITLANTADLNEEGFKNLRLHLEQINLPSTIIVNGDVVVNGDSHQQDSLTIEKLASLVKGLSNVTMVILPGDRDWNDSGKNGWKRVRGLEKLVNSMKLPNVVWPIKKGCPGPEALVLNDHLLLITIQTQWWNHPYDKPDPADADCKIASEDNFNEELEDIIEENEDKNILIAGHFPIISYGPYGGKWPFHKYLVPVPVLSGMIPSFRANVGTTKDINNYNFKHLREEMEQVLQEQDNLIYLSGHEHNLQILKVRNHYLVNSGSPSNPGYAGKGKRALYSESHAGIIALQYFDNGKVTATVQSLLSEGTKKEQEFVLLQSGCNSSPEGVPINARYVPCKKGHKDDKMAKTELGSQTLAAGSEYKASKFKESWLGKHYRDSWTTSVTVPSLNLDTTFQGLVPYQKGGGRQTTSLKFKAGNGGEYVFRSVNKDPTKALDFELRETIVGTVVRDQTTTQQPYGALAVDKLLNELDILHAQPRLYVLPNDSKLGVFNEPYRGLFGMLEERPTNPKKVDLPFAQADEVLKSYKMFRALYDDHDNKVDTKEFARARVFDLWVGDWGKHEDNWKWAGYDQNGGTLYRPIPRDRDHVFSLWDGFFPWLADREWAKASAANFGHDFKGIRSLMWQARHLDRFLLSELTRKDWQTAAQYIQEHIDDRIIEGAVQNMPNEIYEADGKEIASKLNHRLKNLDKAAMEYYDLLAKYVDVVGSNKKEYFSAVRHKDGSVDVAVFDLKEETGEPDSTRKYFQRKFLPNETKEIRLYGLQKADKFRITGEAKSSIKIRTIGGPGTDDISDDSKVGGLGKHTLIYEKSSDAKIELGTEGRRVSHWDNSNYNYNRTDFAYNTYFPSAMVLYSADMG
ncbi:MAG: metallophosphoesterase, partial [Cyclobacteriaceae bacterium]